MQQARSSEVAFSQAGALPHRAAQPATVQVYDLELRPVASGADDGGARSGAGIVFPGRLPVPVTDPPAGLPTHCPAVARRLILAASTLGQRQCWDQAGHQAMLAAWVCDDASAVRPGRACRRIAAAYWNKALACGMSLCGTAWYDDALLVEVLRRSGDFARAAQACLGALGRTTLDGVQHILHFQLERIHSGDAGQHSMGEALAWAAPRSPAVLASSEPACSATLGAVETRSPFDGHTVKSTRRMA